MPLRLHRSQLHLPDTAHSLRWPLMISLSGATLLTLVVMGLWVFLFTSRTEQHLWQDRQDEAAQDASRAVQAYLQFQKDGLSLVGGLDAGLLAAHPEMLQAVLSQREDWLEIARFDRHGQVFASAARQEALLTGPFTTPPTWLSQALNGIGSSDLQFSPSKQPFLFLTVQALDGDVIAARMRPDGLWAMIRAVRFGETGQAYIAGLKNGQLIAFPDPTRVQSGAAVAALPYYHPLLTGAETWSGGYTGLNGTSVLGHADRIPGTDWILVTEFARSESTSLQHFALAVFGAGLLALWGLTAITTIRFLTGMIYRPIENLRLGAEIVGQGDLQHRVPVTRDDEIGKVTAAFNQMSENLAENEQRLRSAYGQALEASRFKSEILANVSHELRTPLGVILGFAEMLRDGVYGFIADEQRQPLNDIVRSVQNLSEIINNLLDQAKLQSCQVHVKVDAFEPAEILRPVVERMSSQVERKGLEMETEIDAALPPVLYGDSARLRQIINNLAGNAVKFTERGKVSLRLLQPGPDHWAIQVADTGCGIPSEAQSHIFEPFRQLDGSATRMQNGTGLGLAIVQQLAELMNGKILLESTPGRGSTFTILFPLILAEGQ